MARRKRMPKFGKTGCLFWLLLLLAIVVIFVYKGKGSFKETFALLKKSVQKESVEESEEIEKVIEEEKTEEVKLIEETEEDKEYALPETENVPEKQDSETESHESQTRVNVSENKIKTKKLKATLYFVKINKGDGSAQPIPVIRTIEYKDSPITKTINALLEGSSEAERQNGIISFIPEGTRLISAHIKNDHLTLNFSSKLEENFSGREAILLELSQIMLTSFDFHQVKKVSILIEGSKKQYITGEGIPLKEVYTKQDLSQLNPGG